MGIAWIACVAWIAWIAWTTLIPCVPSTAFAEAEFSNVKVNKSGSGPWKRHKRHNHANNRAKLRDFFRLTESLYKLREADKSVKVDKVARRPVTDLFSAATQEVEQCLGQHGHALLREQLDLSAGYDVKVVEVSQGRPVKFAVRARRRPRMAHEAFTVFHRTRIVAASTSVVDGSTRLFCSCPHSKLTGIPCRHLCAVNKGAGLEDVDLRYHNAAIRGDLDDELFDFAARPAAYPGAVMSVKADAWATDGAREWASWQEAADVSVDPDFWWDEDDAQSTTEGDDRHPQGASASRVSRGRQQSEVMRARGEEDKAAYSDVKAMSEELAADVTSVLAGRIPCMAVDGAHSHQLGTAMLNNAADLMDEIRAFVRDKLSEKDGPWDKLAQDAKAVPANTRPGSSKLCTEVRAHSRSMTS